MTKILPDMNSGVNVQPNIMRLEYVKCRNFKGLKNFTLTPGGKDAFIYGANAAGKTTLNDMVSYLLFDKDSAGNSNFEIKPKGMENPEVEVEGRFVNNDGAVILRKTYKEKWTKPRGALNKELTGHTTDYFVNDVPVKQSEYKAKVGEIATKEDLFKLLTSPTHFNEVMHWTKRRELLFDISGSVTDEQVIESMSLDKDDLEILTGIVNEHDTDGYKKIVMGKRKKINEEIESIPARIDEQDRSRPELLCSNSQTIIDRLIKLRADLDKKNEEIANVKGGGGVAELRTKLAELEGERVAFVNKHNSLVSEKGMGLRDELQENKDILAELSRSLAEKNRALENNKALLKELTVKRENLVAEYKGIKASVFTADACPTCGQDMPGESVEAASAAFNEAKSKSLADNVSKGKACSAEIAETSQAISGCEKELSNLSGKIASAKLAGADLQEKIDKIKNTIPSLGDLPEIVEFLTRKNDLEKQIEGLQKDKSETIDKLNAEKSEIDSKITEQNKLMSQLEQSQAIDLRVAELKEQEKKLAGEFEVLAKHLFLIEQFIKAKVSLLEDSINGLFTNVQFELFRDQINGGIEEICQATVGGVPYHSVNHAAKIAAGCEILEVVGRYYNFFPVTFIDGRESVTELPAMTAQVVSLVVSPEDKKLRVELCE